MVRNFFIGGNWKMNGSVTEAKSLVELLNSFEVPANTGKKDDKKRKRDCILT